MGGGTGKSAKRGGEAKREAGKAAPRRSYDEALKRTVATEVASGRISEAEALAQFGIADVRTIRAWLKKYGDGRSSDPAPALAESTPAPPAPAAADIRHPARVGRFPRRARSYAVSVILSIVPLTLVFAANYYLYAHLGIGVKRDIYDLIRSDESLYREVTGGSAAPSGDPGETRPARWRGTPEKPANLFFLGSSPTRAAIFPAFADDLEREFNIHTHNMGAIMFAADRYPDYAKMIATKERIDILVVEINAIMASDFALVFKNRWEPGTSNWSGHFFDPSLRRLYDSIWMTDGAPERMLSYGDGVAAYRFEYDVMSSRLAVITGDRRKPTDPPAVSSYGSHLDRWQEAYGYTDVSPDMSPWLVTNLMMNRSLTLLAGYCRAEGIGLIIYVPPLDPRIIENRDNECPRAAVSAYFTRRELQRFSIEHGIQVFDYADFYKDTSLFMDSVHLSNEAAALFSPVIFRDIGEYIASGPAPAAHVFRGAPPDIGPYLRIFEPGPNPAPPSGRTLTVSSGGGTSP